MVRLEWVYVSVPAVTVLNKVVGLALVPLYTLYDTKSLSLFADHVNTTWVLPGVATRPVGVGGIQESSPSQTPHLSYTLPSESQ